MSLSSGKAVDIVIRACNDVRYKADNFIVSEITAELLRRNGIEMTLKAFRDFLKNSAPDFVTHTGNEKRAPLMKVNVYSMKQIKNQIKGGE